jgi:hypothetical protein
MNENLGLFDLLYVSPDNHDYGTLEGVYEHLDGLGGGGGNGEGKGAPDCTEKPTHPKCRQDASGNSNGDFGKAVGQDDNGRANHFEKDLGRLSPNSFGDVIAPGATRARSFSAAEARRYAGGCGPGRVSGPALHQGFRYGQYPAATRRIPDSIEDYPVDVREAGEIPAPWS